MARFDCEVWLGGMNVRVEYVVQEVVGKLIPNENSRQRPGVKRRLKNPEFTTMEKYWSPESRRKKTLVKKTA